MASIFTRIIRGEIPCIKLVENDYCIAFMDIFPLRKGHVLVVPKAEVNEFYDLNDRDLSELILFSKKISLAMKKVFEMRIGLSIIGLEVPHTHIHLIPIESANDINFNQEKPSFSQEELQVIANQIKEQLTNII